MSRLEKAHMHPLAVLETPRNLGPKISEKRKTELQIFAEFILDEINKTHSLSYVRDIAVNLIIRRGVNLVLKEGKNGTRIYQYIVGGRTIYMQGEQEIDFVGKLLLELVSKRKRKKESKTKKKIIL